MDILFVLTNWGKKYIDKPEQKEIDLAKQLADNGNDIIIGDQAHWVQNHDQYKHAFISYGLKLYIKSTLVRKNETRNHSTIY